MLDCQFNPKTVNIEEHTIYYWVRSLSTKKPILKDLQVWKFQNCTYESHVKKRELQCRQR